jgi:O-antigen/teichoic acid export membrane protein
LADLRQRVASGLAWVGLAASVVAVLDFVVIAVILAKWLTPAEYGIAVPAITLFPVLDVATELGLAGAVIQRDDHSHEKISAVFWVNLACSVVMFGLLALAAPAYGRLEGHAIIGTMLTLYGLKLIAQNAYVIPMAMLRREFRYRELSLVRIVANLAEFTTKIIMAATGWGVWCFLGGRFAHIAVNVVGMQWLHPWRPRFVMKLRDARDYLTFGLKTSASQILFQIYTNVDYVVVGYFFGSAATGLYKLAYDLVLEPVRFVSGVVIEIAFAAFSRLRGDREKLVAQFVSFTKLNLLLVLPFLALLAIVADDLIRVVWGEQWIGAATATRILCLVGVCRALSFVVPPLLDGMGRPELTLRYMTIATIVLPLSFVGFAAKLGPSAGWLSVAIAWAVGYPFAFAVLVILALGSLELSLGSYLASGAGVAACVAVASGISVAAWTAAHAASVPPLVRIAIAAGALLGPLALLVSRLLGMSPAAAFRAVRGER